jgi:transposase
VDKESLELLSGQGLSLEQIGARFGKHPSTVSYWMGKYGLTAVHREKHSSKRGIGREQLQALVDQGKTISEIAEAVGRCTATVRHWLRRYELRTAAAQRIEQVRAARDGGHATIALRCARHGDAEFTIEGRGYFRCKQCRTESVARRRRKLKALLVAERGGRCALCGYDRCVAALEFHHVDPSQKRLGISYNGVTLSLEALRAEADKCVLVCSNCHAELEAGVVALPSTLSEESRASPKTSRSIHHNPG